MLISYWTLWPTIIVSLLNSKKSLKTVILSSPLILKNSSENPWTNSEDLTDLLFFKNLSNFSITFPLLSIFIAAIWIISSSVTSTPVLSTSNITTLLFSSSFISNAYL